MYTDPKWPCDPEDFHDRIYAGQILRFAALPPLQELVGYTRAFLEDTFSPHHPTEIHRHLSHEAQVERFAACARAFGQSGEVKELWRALFESVGLDAGAIARDRLRLRFQPHQSPERSMPRTIGTSTVAFHRDTWGTNLYAQTNWWTPVYPITAGRTMAMYPGLWSGAVRNSTAAFDLGKVIERRKSGGDQPVNADELVPHLLEEVVGEIAVPVVIDPGTIIAFSSAHAHAGVGNHTGLTRISLETRTIAIGDLQTGKGAPNLDGDAPWMAPGLFRRVSDGTKLNELLGLRRLEPYRR